MTLATDEFIRRFLIHVLPRGFHRIRHYGLLAKAVCADNITRARELLAVPKRQAEPAHATDDSEPHPCPHCGGRMIIIETFERGSVPRRSFSMSSALACKSWRLVSSMLRFWLTSVFTCTGRYRPTRIICAMHTLVSFTETSNPT
jgi:hypothetical protein